MAGNGDTPTMPHAKPAVEPTTDAGAGSGARVGDDVREDRVVPRTDPSPRPIRALRSAAGLGALATLGATFLPWASSGARSRSSYAIIDVVERAGVLSQPWAGLSTGWFLLPVLVGAALLAVSVGSARLVALTTGTIAALVITGGLLVARSPLVVEPGLVLAVGAGACTGCMGIGIMISTRRHT